MRIWGGFVAFALCLAACGGATSTSPDASDGSGGDSGTGGSGGSGGSSGPGPSACEEGTTSEGGDGCNSCSCLNGLWACTNVECPPDPTSCTPGSVYDGPDCQTCVCSSEGVLVCEEGCDRLCEPGTVKSAGDGCNTCSCGEGGTWACTDAACPEPSCPLPEDYPEQTCDDESAYYGRAEGTDACCRLCDYPLGYHYYETLEACEASKVCAPGETKYADDQCNICTCAEDGTWVCTGADCEPVYCGGFAGDTCTEDEFCAYEADSGGCGVGDASAICRPRPSECTEEEDPVCTCGAVTFSNKCLANQAGYGIAYNGECQ